MTFVLTTEERAEHVARMADGLRNVGFHNGKATENVEAQARSIEQRAYAAVQAASSTTTGSRPRVEMVKLYAYEASKLMVATLLEPDATPSAAAPVQAGVLDLSFTAREFVSAERATELLAPLHAPGAKTTSVRLATKSFGKDAAEVAAAAFRHAAASLVEVDLSDSIAGRPEEEAKGALRIMCDALAPPLRLEALTVSDNALGEKGVRACGTALSKQRLQRLTLENVGASSAALAALSELMVDATALRQLHLWNGMSGDDGATALCPLLSRAPALADFKFGYSRVGTAGGVALAGALGQGGRALVRLNLTGNTMGPPVGPALAAALRGHAGLKVLLLNDAQMGDQGASALALSLAECCPELEELDLGGNELTHRAGPALAKCVATKACLQVLRLPDNELGDKGSMAVAGALGSCASKQLRELDFSSCEVKSAGALALSRAAAAKKCRRLNLNGNMISAAGVAAARLALGPEAEAILGDMEDNDEDADDEDEEEEDGGDVDLDMGKATL